jgi:hypothetical protein
MTESPCQRLICALIGTLAFSGCESGSNPNAELPLRTAKPLNPPAAPAAPQATSADPAQTTERNFDGAVFQVPGNWVEVPKGSTYLTAEFQVPGTAGNGRLTLSAVRGSVEENARRWHDQFIPGPNDPAAKDSPLTVDGKSATLVEAYGTFQDSSRQAVGPQQNWALLGVIVPLSSTNYFIKLTGPRETLHEVRESFLKFAETAKFND